MSATKPLRLKVNKRRYSQLKNTSAGDEAGHPQNRSPLPTDESFYRQIFDRNRAMKMIVDPDTAQIIEVNAAACAFYGYTREEFIKLNVKSLSVLTQAEIVADMQHTVADAGKIFEGRHRLASGEFRDVEIFSGSFEINDKPYLYAIIQDITARKQAEKALRESEALYKLFARNMPNSAVFMFDHDMRYTLAEGPFLKRFGTVYDNIIGKTIFEALPEQAATFLAAIMQRALNGEAFSYERVYDNYAYQAFAAPVRDDNGRIVGGMILSRDISEAKQAADALRESEHRYQSIITTMSEGVIMQQQDGTIESCNAAAERILGLSADQMMGLTSIDPRWQAIHEDGRPFPGETHPAMVTLRTGQPQNNVIMGVHKPDGSLVWISINSNPLMRPHETQPYAVVITLIDITERKRAEDALRTSETRFHSLVDLAPVGIIQTDVEGKRVFCNNHWCEMTGITLEQALGDEHYETIYPDDLPIAADAWEEMMASNLPFDKLIFRYQRPDKSTVWVSGNGRPLYDAQGHPTGYLGAVTDISHLKALENTLMISESRFRTLVNLAPVGIVETDVEGNPIFTNARWHSLSGVPKLTPRGENASSTIHPDDREWTQKLNQASTQDGAEVNNIEYRFLHPDGKVVWVSDSSRPLINPDGTVSGHIIAMTDITERKWLEEALRRNEEQLRFITDNVQDLVTLVDASANFVFASPSHKAVLGYDSAGLIGNSSVELVHPDDRPAMLEAFGSAYQQGMRQIRAEVRLRHADGHYIYFETMGTFLFEGETFIGGVLTSRDISERKRLQNLMLETERLQSALDKEHELSSMKTRMMERIAHEFRTPLTVIQSSTETLTTYLDRLTPEQRSAKAVTIQGQIQRLTDMLHEIGLAVKGSFTPDRIHRQPTDVSAMCRELAAELEQLFKVPNKYVLNLPEKTVVALDPHVFKNALRQIMRNAARFSDAAAPVNVSLSQDEDHFTLRVTDHGIGILPHERSQVFEPFFRGSNISEISGLGVGLTITKAAIVAHGGTIDFESVAGEGTTFIINLPV
jgi:PAS domain S-box-containing protein